MSVFLVEKGEFISKIAENCSIWNLHELEQFLNAVAVWNKDNNRYKIVVENDKIRTNCFNYSFIGLVEFNEFKSEFIEFLNNIIENAEDMPIFKELAYYSNLYTEPMPTGLKIALFNKLVEFGELDNSNKYEFLQLLEDAEFIGNWFEFDEYIYESEGVKEYLSLLEFDVVEMKSFKYDVISIGIVESALYDIATNIGYNEKELNCIGIIGICHLLEYKFGKRYFSSTKRQHFGMPLK